MPSRSFISDGDILSYPVYDGTNVLQKGSIMHWIAPYHSRGTNTSNLRIFTVYVDDDNYITMFFTASANTVTLRYRCAGSNYDVTFTPDEWTIDDWIDIGCSWDAANGFLKAYWEGTEVGTRLLLSTAISASAATLYLGNGDITEQFIGRRDRFDLHAGQMLDQDFERFTVKRFA